MRRRQLHHKLTTVTDPNEQPLQADDPHLRSSEEGGRLSNDLTGRSVTTLYPIPQGV